MNKTMNKMMVVSLGVAMMLGIGISTVNAQESDTAGHNVVITVNERALLDLNDTANVTFTIDAQGAAPDAGDPIVVIDGNNLENKYLQYTSIVGAKDKTRKITVYIDSADNIPAGTTLTVLPTAPTTGEGQGQSGKGTAVTTAIDLSEAATQASAKPVVEGIKSCSTGKGPTSGVQLVYDLEINNQDAAVAGLFANVSYTVVVTYTLTESAL